MTIQLLVEDTRDLVQEGVAVDPESGAVRNVMLVGLKSRNRGGIYYGDALEAACSLYEGVPAIPGHTSEWGDRNIPIVDYLAYVTKPRFLKTKGIQGDLVPYDATDARWKRFTEIAAKTPKSIGISHEAWVEMDELDKKDAKRVGYAFKVTKIESVKAVAIVSDPATLKNLQESRRGSEGVNTMNYETLKSDHPDLFARVRGEGVQESASGNAAIIAENLALKGKVQTLEQENTALKESAKAAEKASALDKLLAAKGMALDEKDPTRVALLKLEASEWDALLKLTGTTNEGAHTPPAYGYKPHGAETNPPNVSDTLRAIFGRAQ